MKMYNETQKVSFLTRYPENTKKSYEWLFSKSCQFENKLNKDLSEFNENEISELVEYLSPITVSSARSYGGRITSYLNWSNNGDRSLNIDTKWFEQFVKENVYYSSIQIEQIENSLVNAQDSIVIRLLFEGIEGSDFSEILNIKNSDINYEKREIKLVDDRKGERTVSVSERCLELMKKSFTEDRYWNKNGTANNEKRLYSVLLENDYLIRSNKTKTENEERADKFIIYRRLKNIKESLGLQNITAKLLSQSGMINFASRYEDVTKEVLTEIAKRFSLNKINNNGYMIYNYRTMKQFINKENLKNLYPSNQI